MHTACEFIFQRQIDHSMLIDSRFSRECRALDDHPEMGLNPPGMHAVMSLVLVGFIDDFELCRLEGLGQNMKDSVASCHVWVVSMMASVREGLTKHHA